MSERQRDLVAQWAFDTRSILGRFHLWLEDVEDEVEIGGGDAGSCFVGPGLERCFVMAAAVTALGTRLFGRYGEGRDAASRQEINRVKKDADAVSAYTLSESLWYLTRGLPENHALMVCLGEGLMPKAGETPEMGSNPQIGFGRVYARPQVAAFLDRRVQRLVDDEAYGWREFWREVRGAGITVWGAAIDTLENTSRFAKGKDSGPMTVLHVFDQPLSLAAPYEGYVGNLVLPRAVREQASRRSLLLTYHTPRRQVMEAIRETYPELLPEHVHVWTLGGASRERRLGGLWREWREAGAHVIEDGWPFPGGGPAFVDSGTYAPTFRVGLFVDDQGRRHLLVCDGYSASAEAIQAASLDPILETYSSMSLFSSIFALPVERERDVMRLDSESPVFAERLREVAGEELPPEQVEHYRESIRAARDAGLPCERFSLEIDDFFPLKRWRSLAVAGLMLPDPYSGLDGVEEVGEGVYRVTVRSATRFRLRAVTVTLRLTETFDDSRLVFSPLLDRFYAGEDHARRAVKVSDSGRIRNELQTLCSTAIDHLGDKRMRVDFSRVGPGLMPPDKAALIRKVLLWYKECHPIWFSWLEVTD